MAGLPKLTPYVAEEQIAFDNYYTHYRASATHLEGEHSYIVTEFNPSFMVRRNDDGVLEPTERFVMEFETALERFTNLGEALESLNEPFVAPIAEILHLNNTVYIVRQEGGRYRNLEAGLGSKRMEFTEAYVYMRPLLLSLVAAWKKRLIFQFAPGNLGLNSYGQLVLDSMFAWEGDHRHMITELGKLYYRLMAGVEYNPSIPDNPLVDDLGLPPRLYATVKELLAGDAHYGSIDDFNKQLRTVLDAEGKKEIISAVPVKKAEPKIVNKKAAIGVISGIAAVIVLLIAAPIIWMVVNQEDEGGYEGYAAAPGESAPLAPPTPAAPAAFVRLHSGYAVTDPRDATVMLNGSFFEQGGEIYQVVYQSGFGLARRRGNAVETVVSGVRPAFITAHGEFIYFSDGQDDYNIRRVRADGSGLETVSNHTASFLLVQGNGLFYTNHSDRDFLYRLDLGTMQSEPFLRVAAYETVAHGGRLYFVNGSGNFRIYSVPADGGTPVRVNDANSANLRISGGHIFYRNVEDDSINRVNMQGRPVPLEIDARAAGFDVNGGYIAVLAAGTNELTVYRLADGERISYGIGRASYVMLDSEGTAHFIDYNDSRTLRGATRPVLVVAEELEEDAEGDAEEDAGE